MNTPLRHRAQGTPIGAPKPWTDAEIAFAKKQHAAGASAAEVAAQLPGRSRNAILGMWHRKGLMTAKTITVKPKPAPKIQTPLSPKRLASKLKAAEEQVEIPETTFAGDGITLEQLTKMTCRWPRGEPGTDGFRYCGASADLTKDRPYCNTHRRMAYEPPTARKTREERRGWKGAKGEASIR